jgi:ribosomal-protein-alanine N-acetyltransferase
LKPVRLYVLSPGAAGDGFSTAEVRYVNQGIVERGIDVRYTPALRYFLLRQWSHIQVNIRAGQPSSPYLTFLELRLIETEADALPLKSLRIRPASATDLQAICLIEDHSFSDPYPRYLLKRLLDEIRNIFLVAENRKGALVGYCVSSIEERLAHLISIAVLTEGRRKGVATALLKNLIEYLEAHRVEELWLEVKQGNKEAIKLYEKFDFASMMILENYYSDGSAALRMRMSFKKQAVKAGHKQR